MSDFIKPVILNHFTGSIQDKLDLYIDEYPVSGKLDDLKLFIETNCHSEIGDEILLRLAHSIINRWDGDTGQKCNKALPDLASELFDEFCPNSTLSSNDLIEKLLHILGPLVYRPIEQEAIDDHRKVAMVLCILVKKYSDSIDYHLLSERVIEYLKKVVGYGQKWSFVLLDYCSDSLKEIFNEPEFTVLNIAESETQTDSSVSDCSTQTDIILYDNENNQSNLVEKEHFFNDGIYIEKKMQFDEWINAFNSEFANNYFEANFNTNLQIGKLTISIYKQEHYLGFLQSIVENLGLNLHDDQFSAQICIFTTSFYNIYKGKISNSATFNKLLTFYLNFSNKIKNVCYVAMLLYTNITNIKENQNFFLEITQTLDLQIKKNQPNKSNILFLILALEKFSATEENKKQMAQLLPNLLKIINIDDDKISSHYYKPFLDFTQCQIDLCIRTLNNFLSGKITDASTTELKSNSHLIAVLGSNKNLKFSSDFLSVRNDSHSLQSAVSIFPIISGVYYYEVVLMTSGIFRIGWKTKSKINEFDGFSKYCCGMFFKIEKNIYRWKAGDVIGALIDTERKKFVFSVNGNQMDFKPSNNLFFVPPYFATISLGPFQQCLVNFGQVPFKYPPTVSLIKKTLIQQSTPLTTESQKSSYIQNGSQKNSETIRKTADHYDYKIVKEAYEFKDFYTSVSKFIKEKICLFCTLKPAIVRFNSCDHWEMCTACAEQLNKCPNCEQ